MCSVASTSLWPFGLWPSRLLCPGIFFTKNTGVGCYFLLQGTILTQGLNPCLLDCRWILHCWGTREAWEHSSSKFSRGSHSVGRRLGRMQAQQSMKNPNNRWLFHFGLRSRLWTSFHGPGEIPIMLFYDGLASVLIKASKGLFNIRHKERGFGLLYIDPAWCQVRIYLPQKGDW